MKKSIFILFGTIIITNMNCLERNGKPEVQWQKSFGGSEEDKAYCAKETKDGGYIVAGISLSRDGDVFVKNDSMLHGETWIVKLCKTGDIVWQKLLPGDANSTTDLQFSIQQTNDGGYIYASYSDGSYLSGVEKTGNHGSSDFLIVKLDSHGNVLWLKSLGGTDPEEAYSIEQTKDGGYIVAGFTMSNDGDIKKNYVAYKKDTTYFGNVGLVGLGSINFWVVKLDDGGNIQWQESLGGSGVDEAYSIQQTNDEGYIVAGRSGSTDGAVTGNHGKMDCWVVKLDKVAKIQWQKSFGGSADDGAQCIRQTSDGGYIIAGYSESEDGDVTGNHGAADYWVIKLNSSGNMQWQKSLGGSDIDVAGDIEQTKDGGYVVAGQSRSNDGDVTGNHGKTDYWIVKLDTLGKIQWEKTLGGSGVDQAYSIQQTTDDGYVVAGTGDSGGENNPNPNYWIVKLK